MTADGQQIPEVYLALAVIVAKGKPRGISIEDYILALRRSLSQTQHASRAFSTFNLCTVERDLVQTEEQTPTLLQAKARRPDATAQEVNCTSPPSSSKRKAFDQIPTGSGKMRKINSLPACASDLGLPKLTVQQRGDPPRQYRFCNHQPLTDRPHLLSVLRCLAQTNAAELLFDGRRPWLVQLTSDAILVCLEKCNDGKPLWSSPQNLSITLHETCFFLKKTCSVLLMKAHDLSCSDSRSERLTAVLSPFLCSVTKALLGRLHQFCLREAEWTAKSQQLSKQNKTCATKGHATSTEGIVQLKHACNVMCETTVHVLAHVTQLYPKYPEIFQRTVEMFLQHLGSTISLIVFADREVKDDGIGIAPPQGLVDLDQIELEHALLTTELQAPYMITILDALVQSVIPQVATNFHKQKSLTLNRGMRVMLQRALLKGIFGDDFDAADTGVVSEDLGTLSNSGCPEGDSYPTQSGDIKMWYPSRVWDILGWDILTNSELTSPIHP